MLCIWVFIDKMDTFIVFVFLYCKTNRTKGDLPRKALTSLLRSSCYWISNCRLNQMEVRKSGKWSKVKWDLYHGAWWCRGVCITNAWYSFTRRHTAKNVAWSWYSTEKDRNESRTIYRSNYRLIIVYRHLPKARRTLSTRKWTISHGQAINSCEWTVEWDFKDVHLRRG